MVPEWMESLYDYHSLSPFQSLSTRQTLANMFWILEEFLLVKIYSNIYVSPEYVSASS